MTETRATPNATDWESRLMADSGLPADLAERVRLVTHEHVHRTPWRSPGNDLLLAQYLTYDALDEVRDLPEQRETEQQVQALHKALLSEWQQRGRSGYRYLCERRGCGKICETDRYNVCRACAASDEEAADGAA